MSGLCNKEVRNDELSRYYSFSAIKKLEWCVFMQSFDDGMVGPQGSWYLLIPVVSGYRTDLSEVLL